MTHDFWITEEDRQRGRTRVFDEIIKELKEAYLEEILRDGRASIRIRIEAVDGRTPKDR
jgi:hypothetical protein